MTFLRPANGARVTYEHAHESPFAMSLPLFILGFASIFVGYATRDMMIGMGSDFWGNALFTLPSKQYLLESEWLDSSIKLIPLFFSFSGVFLSLYHYNWAFRSLYSLKETSVGRGLYTFLNRKWFFDKVYNEWVSQPVLRVAYTHAYQNMDRGLLEFLGPHGLSTVIYGASRGLASIQLGFLFHILFLLLCSLTLLLFVAASWNVLLPLVDIRMLAVLVPSFFFLSLETESEH